MRTHATQLYAGTSSQLGGRTQGRREGISARSPRACCSRPLPTATAFQPQSVARRLLQPQLAEAAAVSHRAWGLPLCRPASKRRVHCVCLTAGGNLFSYVQSAIRLKEPAARWFFQQLVIGLDYCHRKGVVNRDIKLENTLLQMVDVSVRHTHTHAHTTHAHARTRARTHCQGF